MRRILTWMVIASLLTSPVTAQASDRPRSQEPEVKLQNVELTRAGHLEGQLLDGKGTPIRNASVSVRSRKNRSKVATVLTTDADGRFVIADQGQGICVFEVGKDSYACRVWKHGAAPPKSLTSVAVVRTSGPIVRGASQVNELRALSPATKILLGVLFAMAIAIPLAVDDDDAS